MLRLTDGELLDVVRASDGETSTRRSFPRTTNATRPPPRGRATVEPPRGAPPRRGPIAVRERARVRCGGYRRAARRAVLLVFATLRLLAEPTVEAPDAFDEAQRARARRFLAAARGNFDVHRQRLRGCRRWRRVSRFVSGAGEFQLIESSLVERIGEDAAERAFRDVKAGGVVDVVAQVRSCPH